MKKYLLFGALGIVAIGAIVGYMMWNKPHKNIVKAAPDLIMESTNLFSDYEADEATANTKYLNKLIQVTGVVKLVTRDDDGKVSIVLDSGSELAGVICELDELTKHPRTDFKEGEKITIKGICTGMLMDVVLVRCVVVS